MNQATSTVLKHMRVSYDREILTGHFTSVRNELDLPWLSIGEVHKRV
jgi:hypothetical protein